MVGGERDLIALFGERGEFIMRAEISGIQFERLGPTLDAEPQRCIDIEKCVFGGNTRGGIAGLADPVEDPAGLCLLFRFVTKKRVLEGYVGVILIQAHGLPELIAGGFGFTGFEQCVGKVLADGRSGGGGFDGSFERDDRFVVILGPKMFVGLGQRDVGRIGAGCWSLRACERAKSEDWDYEPHGNALEDSGGRRGSSQGKLSGR